MAEDKTCKPVKRAPAPIAAAFLENKGQLDPAIKYILRQNGITAIFFQNGLLLGITSGRLGAIIKITYQDCNPLSNPEGKEPVPDKLRFFDSAEIERVCPGLGRWSQLCQKNVWEGIDLSMHAHAKGLKIDWIIRPGADPGKIGLLWEGVGGLLVNEEGELIISHPIGKLRELCPYCYQEAEGKTVEIDCRHTADGSVSGFEAGEYDPKLPLVIDPTFTYISHTDPLGDMFL